MGSLPEGLTLPVSTSAKALPVSEAGLPGDQDPGGVFLGQRHDEGAAVENDGDGVFVDPSGDAHDVFLAARQAEVGHRAALPQRCPFRPCTR